jgi:hypothetical protein
MQIWTAVSVYVLVAILKKHLSLDLGLYNRNRLPHDHGEIQLHRPLDFLLFSHGDILANRLRGSLHRFRGYFQIGQQFICWRP